MNKIFLVTCFSLALGYNAIAQSINPLVIGTIHPDDSIVVVYDVTIVNPLPIGTGVTRIGNQATLSGANFANIVTDDPDTGTALDSTFTNLLNVLPVTLVDFTAMKQKNIVLVQWHTSQEVNSDHFEVQHSLDATGFRSIGSVAAAGQSNTEKAYSFVHGTPAKGINYYRLKQFDLSGRAIIYAVRSVNFDEKNLQQIFVYPNPVTKGTLNIQLANIGKGNYTLTLVNAAGEKVYGQQIVYNGDGAPVPVSLPTVMASGSYKLTVQNKDVKLSRLILVQ